MCGCIERTVDERRTYVHEPQVDKVSGKWIIDAIDRKLYVESSIRDVYGDIIGYITKNEAENTIRIFSKNVKKILE